MNAEVVHESEQDAVDQVVIAKISLSTIGAMPTRIKRADTTIEETAIIGGVARGVVYKKNRDTGEMLEGLAGDFIGKCLIDDNEFRSGVCYLPAGIQESIATLVRGDNPVPVEFMVKLQAVKAKNPAGYSWQAVPLHKPETADPLQKFKVLMMRVGKQKQLEHHKV